MFVMIIFSIFLIATNIFKDIIEKNNKIQTLEMAQNIVKKQKLKSTITECHKNCQVSVARDQKLTKESNL